MTFRLKPEKSEYENATLYTYFEDGSRWEKTKRRVRICDEPFAKGSERVCYKMRILDDEGKEESMVSGRRSLHSTRSTSILTYVHWVGDEDVQKLQQTGRARIL